jgi:hypothetical protein
MVGNSLTLPKIPTDLPPEIHRKPREQMSTEWLIQQQTLVNLLEFSDSLLRS